ncbi:hypothetical protein [Sulfobacillus harzensis]|uniref:Uncharacterized protein n=1 Tax=Sulfobacillus harzensis TaxID=2729629 RepID=A0A7Y0L706_9FIRM|nr:hypothetical protein [Sulfobacillus harzensis]NMP24462.1 hypothetical protein [Sulfobacillus harzensis]
MQSVRIYFDDEDAALVSAIAAMPKGERSTRLKALIGLALSGTGGLLVRIEALERRMDALGQQSPPPAEATPRPAPTVDAQKAAIGLFKKFGALDEDS